MINAELIHVAFRKSRQLGHDAPSFSLNMMLAWMITISETKYGVRQKKTCWQLKRRKKRQLINVREESVTVRARALTTHLSIALSWALSSL
jgi:hypothetical protein